MIASACRRRKQLFVVNERFAVCQTGILVVVNNCGMGVEMDCSSSHSLCKRDQQSIKCFDFRQSGIELAAK